MKIYAKKKKNYEWGLNITLTEAKRPISNLLCVPEKRNWTGFSPDALLRVRIKTGVSFIGINLPVHYFP